MSLEDRLTALSYSDNHLLCHDNGEAGICIEKKLGWTQRSTLVRIGFEISIMRKNCIDRIVVGPQNFSSYFLPFVIVSGTRQDISESRLDGSISQLSADESEEILEEVLRIAESRVD